MAGRNQSRAADRRKEGNLERKRRKQEENGEECAWRECILTGCSWVLPQFSAVEKLRVYSCVCLTLKPSSSCKVGGGTGTRGEKLAAQLLHLILLLQRLIASQNRCAKAHSAFSVVIYVMAVMVGRGGGLKSICPPFLSGELWSWDIAEQR